MNSQTAVFRVLNIGPVFVAHGSGEKSAEKQLESLAANQSGRDYKGAES